MRFLALLLVMCAAPALAGFREGGDGLSLGVAFAPKKQAPGMRRTAVVPLSTGRQVNSGSVGLGRDVDLGTLVWTANGSANTVTLVVLDALGTAPAFEPFVLQTGAGTEPTNVAVTDDGLACFVTLRGAGKVLPIFIDKARGLVRFGKAIPVGAEPYGIILDSLQKNLYVANSTEGTVSIIGLAAGQVAARIFLGEGSWPFALALKGGLAASEKVYVTSFFSRATKFNNGGETDDSRTGRVFVIAGRKQVGTVSLKPFACFTFPAGSGTKIKGFPNQLNSIAIKGKFGYVLSVGASPQRPVNFTANTQAFLQTFNTETDTEVDAGALNLNEPVETEAVKGLFFNTPWGLALNPLSSTGLALSAASNIAVKVSFDATTGVPSITGAATPASSAGIRRITVGKNPRSVVFSADGNLAYVHDYISRTLSVVGLTAERTVRTIPLSPIPTGPALAILHGEELYNTSLGDSTISPTTPNVGRRMSTNGWGSCFSCHPFGWTDTVVWNFNDGPRKTLPTIGRALAHQRDATDVRMLNWSAVRDELEDFEQNIRKVSSKFDAANQVDDGKTGLMPGISGSPNSPLGPQDIFDIVTAAGLPAKPNKGRSKDWDDLSAYMRSVRSPISPIKQNDPRVTNGLAVFEAIGCNECHAGAKWTSSRRPYDPAKLSPEGAAKIRTDGAQVVDVLRNVDSFVTGEESAVVTNGVPGVAKGAAGFNPPSLISFWAFAPFFHNGKFQTIGQLLRTPMKTGGRIHLLASESAARRTLAQKLLDTNPVAMANLELFLRSIDDRSGIRPQAARPAQAPAQPISQPIRRAAEVSTEPPASDPTGVPGLEAGAKARFKGSLDRKYRPIAIGDGLQSVKSADELAGGAAGGAGATLRGVVFAGANGTFTPTGDGQTTITLFGLSTRATFTARDGALAGDANYSVANLPPGAYRVTVTRPGSATRTSSLPLVLERGQVAGLDVFLEPAP